MVSCPAVSEIIIWSRMLNSPSDPVQEFDFGINEGVPSVSESPGKVARVGFWTVMICIVHCIVDAVCPMP